MQKYGEISEILNKNNFAVYLKWIKFRVDKISWFSMFLGKNVKLNPPEKRKNEVNREN